MHPWNTINYVELGQVGMMWYNYAHDDNINAVRRSEWSMLYTLKINRVKNREKPGQSKREGRNVERVCVCFVKETIKDIP